MKTPTREEVVPVAGDLDQECAWKNFGGKSRDEARVLFADDGLNKCEDLMHMGCHAFCFYVLAAIDYLLSDDSRNDEEMISGFVGVCEVRLEHDAEAIRPSLGDIHRALVHLRKRGDIYSDCYADVPSRVDALLAKMGAEPRAPIDGGQPSG